MPCDWRIPDRATDVRPYRFIAAARPPPTRPRGSFRLSIAPASWSILYGRAIDRDQHLYLPGAKRGLFKITKGGVRPSFFGVSSGPPTPPTRALHRPRKGMRQCVRQCPRRRLPCRPVGSFIASSTLHHPTLLIARSSLVVRPNCALAADTAPPRAAAVGARVARAVPSGRSEH
jgi:hypothetical protein